MIQYIATTVAKKTLTMPGGNMASNRSTPNIPRFERTKVPAANNEQQTTNKAYVCIRNDQVVTVCHKLQIYPILNSNLQTNK